MLYELCAVYLVILRPNCAARDNSVTCRVMLGYKHNSCVREVAEEERGPECSTSTSSYTAT